MTKVDVTYALSDVVDQALLDQIGRAHGIYGLQAVRLSPALDSLWVQYDASRLKLEDVDRALRSAGLAVRRKEE
ncbi:MAG: hypothetical protein ABSC08_02920 [Bryobacteraceae bacterium]|jgi:hypothetical protein